MDSFTEYISEIRKSLEKGDSTEHTHRAALEALLEAYDKDIDATNEPRRIACGAPDFNITRKGVPVGHVETKDIGVNLDEMERGKGHRAENQHKKQRQQANCRNFCLCRPQFSYGLTLRFKYDLRWDETNGIGLIQF
ncbi:MAG: hypothetical protein NT047_09805 [Deltaproteobacteria bacterium]|nr:hypothetical protein [Deltaproteobacteria bacterium]